MMWFEKDRCQPATPLVIGIAGVAGSGKTTLGLALAASLGLPLLDLDTLTNPLLERLPVAALGGHWLASAHSRSIRDGRYAVLRAAARDMVATVGGAVLVAPFTAELRGGTQWSDLLGALAPADFRLIQMVGDPGLFVQRRASRGEARDIHRPLDPVIASPDLPAVPVIPLDADLAPAQQVRHALVRLGLRTAVSARHSLFECDFDAVLFDLDGTLADSTPSVIRSWRRFTQEVGVSIDALHENHGQPAVVLITKLLPAGQAEQGLRRITELELTDATSVRATPGALSLFGSLPESARAVVTSGSRPIAEARMRAAGLPFAQVTVTAEDIRRGKPDPEPYLLAAHRLGADPRRCLVVEDAAAGVRSGRAAGMKVLAVSGTLSSKELAGAHLIIDGLDRVEIAPAGEDGAVSLRLRGTDSATGVAAVDRQRDAADH